MQRTSSIWEQRIRRATELANALPYSAEILNFYAKVAAFQRDLFTHLQQQGLTAGTSSSSDIRGSIGTDIGSLLNSLPSLLSLVEKEGSAELSRAAKQRSTTGRDHWEALLTSYWAGTNPQDGDAAEQFLTRAMLQPLAEFRSSSALKLARSSRPPLLSAEKLAAESAVMAPIQESQTSPTCPFCSRKPLVAVLRPEGQGGKRSLRCGLCFTEWLFQRLMCPACGESDHEKLPIYSASEFEHVRVDCCDTCKTYIKCIDLTKFGLAVPEVDELATTPLNLWAEERGYFKVETNLLGM